MLDTIIIIMCLVGIILTLKKANDLFKGDK